MIVGANQAARSLTGRRMEDMLHKPMLACFPGIVDYGLWRAYLEVAKARSPDGSWSITEPTASPACSMSRSARSVTAWRSISPCFRGSQGAGPGSRAGANRRLLSL